ncbi:MAG: GNAT family N-acetyltransferase [Verrucomicrobiota bacterium]
MRLQVNLLKDAIPEAVDQYFPRPARDAFHEADTQRVLHGAEWYSVLITQGDNGFFHVFAPTAIRGTAWRDIDPFMGYFGPLVKAIDPQFLEAALAEYRNACQSLGIVAEVMRFNPLLENHRPFEGRSELQVGPVKSLVIADCSPDEAAQLARYNQTCRYDVRTAGAELKVGWLETEEEWQSFAALYAESLRRVGAHAKWHLAAAVFERARSVPAFRICAARQDGQLASASLIIEHPLQAYYLLAANSMPRVNGANELSIHRTCLALAERGIAHFILGGGNSASEDDPLLRFKRKFSRKGHTLHLGRMIHMKEAYERLCGEYEAKAGVEARKDYFLRYRLLPEYE